MKMRFAALLLALPLLAFDCGGTKEDVSPFGMACKLQIRGGANEDLWCIVSAVDYASFSPPSTMWAFELVAYRGMTAVGAGVGFFHDGRPALATTYGWNGATTNVDSGGAQRWTGDAMTVQVLTHQATAPLLGGSGTGALSVAFNRIPPPGATGAQLVDVHGTLSGTLPSVDPTGSPVAFTATF